MAPNQEMFIAAASQVTKNIRLGPMVKLLPLHHPVRIIEDMCVVDQLTNGRLDFGVGRGVAPIEHYWFGSNWPESKQRFEDVLGIICDAFANRRDLQREQRSSTTSPRFRCRRSRSRTRSRSGIRATRSPPAGTA